MAVHEILENLTPTQRDQVEKSAGLWRMWRPSERRSLLISWAANAWFGCKVSAALVQLLGPAA